MDGILNKLELYWLLLPSLSLLYGINGSTQGLTISLQKCAQYICIAYKKVINMNEGLKVETLSMPTTVLGQKVHTSDPRLSRCCITILAKQQEVIYLVICKIVQYFN